MAELARIRWAEYRSDLEARGLFTQARANTLDRMVRAMVEYEVLYPVCVAEGPVKKTPEKGSQYVNMLWSQCKNLSDQISKLEKALTLTPESVGEKAPARPIGGPAKADKYLARASFGSRV